jgi:hypothetical protein
MKKNLNGILALTGCLVFLASIVFAGTWLYPIPSGTSPGDVFYAETGYMTNLAVGLQGQALRMGSNTRPTWGLSNYDYPTTLSPTGTATYSLATSARCLVYLNNASNFEVVLSESGAVDGQILEVQNISTGTAGFSNTTGTQKLSGTVTLGRYDNLVFRYVVESFSGGANQWVLVSHQNNN